jgi:streptomycin 3"-adenylyltransferase
MKGDAPAVPAEAVQALPIVRECFGDALLAVYLCGSAVAGGLRPGSDVDLLVVVGRPTTVELRERLVAGLMRVSGRHPVAAAGARPLEVIVFQQADLTPPAYPARSEFLYGEWLRNGFEAGEAPRPSADPEFTLLLAQARRNARVLIGPEPAELLPDIPEADIRRAMGDTLPALFASLEGDERNVLLTLVRMWRTLTSGEFVTKDVAAEWAIPQLPAGQAALIACAREDYLGLTKEDWATRSEEVREVANELSERIAALL